MFTRYTTKEISRLTNTYKDYPSIYIKIEILVYIWKENILNLSPYSGMSMKNWAKTVEAGMLIPC